jgi:hypothetical protein
MSTGVPKGSGVGISDAIDGGDDGDGYGGGTSPDADADAGAGVNPSASSCPRLACVFMSSS